MSKITHEGAKNELATFRGTADYSYNQLWLYIKQQERKEDLSKRIIEQYEGLIKLLEGCANLDSYSKNRLDYNGFKNVIKSLKEEIENEK